MKQTPQTQHELPHRADWEAIERDYRTGRFSLRELEIRHGPSASQICRRAKAHAWTKDLRDVVRQATSAAIMRDLASETATAAQADTTAIVLAAAQVQRDVILRHRRDCALARSIADTLMSELAAVASTWRRVEQVLDRHPDEVTPHWIATLLDDLREAGQLHHRVGSMHRLSDALQRLHQLERRAFGILEEDVLGNPLDAMSVPELEAEMKRLDARLAALAIGQDRAPGVEKDGEQPAPFVH